MDHDIQAGRSGMPFLSRRSAQERGDTTNASIHHGRIYVGARESTAVLGMVPARCFDSENHCARACRRHVAESARWQTARRAPHSSLNSSTGSARIACRAGCHDASSVVRPSTPTTIVHVSGSVMVTPSCSDTSARPSDHAPRDPIATPLTPTTKPSRRTPHSQD